jgi:peptidoglycan-associated lipoprotein
MKRLVSTWGLLGLAITAMAFTSGCASKKGGATTRGSENNVTYGSSADGSSDNGGIGLGTLARVHFDYDSSNLSTDARETLEKNAKAVKENRKMRVLVEGHCDERGSNEYNIALGERRSRAVIDYLVNLGVQRSRLEMKSWGEERPLNAQSSESAWKMNRRAEFVILAK